MEDEKYMRRALDLAQEGRAFVNPNPMVGTVIVKDNKIIGEGYHKAYGSPHSERVALSNLREDCKGATMYVTLEPCCHYGKTPPCTDAIIGSNIKRVVIAMKDPNPLVSGRGIEILKKAGIDVKVGVLEEEARKLNEVFLYYIKTKLPYITVKYAMTADGKISTENGDSKWISSKESRAHSHKLRRDHMGILVGINTVLRDNPLLNCRIEGGKNPLRIICDSNLRLPLNSKIVDTSNHIKTVVATVSRDEKKIKALEHRGIRVITTKKDKNNKVDMRNLFEILGEEGIDSILVEGGGDVNWSVIKEGLGCKLIIYLGNKILGGLGKSSVTGEGATFVKDSLPVRYEKTELLGDDILIEGEFLNNVYRNS